MSTCKAPCAAKNYAPVSLIITQLVCSKHSGQDSSFQLHTQDGFFGILFLNTQNLVMIGELLVVLDVVLHNIASV